MKKRYTINWIGMFNLLGISFILAISGVGAYPIINHLNNLNSEALYGKIVSYFGLLILSKVIFMNIDLIKRKKEEENDGRTES
jgi:hypothetical protein